MATLHHYIGKGIRDADNTSFMIFGIPFGSSPPSGFGTNLNAMTILNPMTTFNVSSISDTHEVSAALTNITINPYEDTGNFWITHRWYRLEGSYWVKFWEYGPHGFRWINMGGTTYSRWVTYNWVGWSPADREHSHGTYGYRGEYLHNGTYKLVVTLTGSIVGSNTFNITITGMPTGPHIPGYTWIENGHIHFIGQRGYEHIVTIKGSGFYNITPGFLWINDTNLELNYTDDARYFVGTYANLAEGKFANDGEGYLWIENCYLFYSTISGHILANKNDS